MLPAKITPAFIAERVGVSQRTARRWLSETPAGVLMPRRGRDPRGRRWYTTAGRLLSYWPDLLGWLRASESDHE